MVQRRWRLTPPRRYHTVAIVSLLLHSSNSSLADQQDASCPAGAAPGSPGCVDRVAFEVPRVIVGCWQLLERDRDEKNAVRTLIRYAENGFDAFDTADIYGPSEQILGQFRRQWTSRPSSAALQPRFFTKYVTEDGGASNADRINSQSRGALGVESLDLVQFHWWHLDQHGRNTDFLGAGKQLMRLESEGKIKHVAACNFDTTNLNLLVEAGITVRANQVQYSLLDRRPEVRLLPYCKKHGIKLLVFGVVAGGLLSDAFLGLDQREGKRHLDSVSRRMYHSSLEAWSGGRWDLFQRLLKVLRKVADSFESSEVNVAHVASQWVLRRLSDLGAGGSLIIGVRDDRHLEEHVRLLQGRHALTDAHMEEIQTVLNEGSRPSGDIWDRERGWTRR